MQVRVFSPTVGRWFGHAWLVFAALNLADIAWRGDSRTAWVIAAVLVLATAVVYVTALRPRIVTGQQGLRIVNPLRDVTVPWGAISAVDAVDAVRVHTTGGSRHRCWAVQALNRHRTRNLRRRGGAGEAPPGRASRTTSGPSSDVAARVAGRSRADYVAAELEELARQGRRHVPAGQTETVAWSMPAVTAVLLSAVLVIVAALAP